MSIADFRIEDHASGGLQITHLASPRFRARWTTGEFPVDQVHDGAFFWTDEGGSQDDTIHLYDLEWLDQVPENEIWKGIVRFAVVAIETHILER